MKVQQQNDIKIELLNMFVMFNIQELGHTQSFDEQIVNLAAPC